MQCGRYRSREEEKKETSSLVFALAPERERARKKERAVSERLDVASWWNRGNKDLTREKGFG